MEVLIGQHVLQATSGTVAGQYAEVSSVHAGPDESDYVLMAHFTDLKERSRQ